MSLVIGIGNETRGDDAAGPLVARRVADAARPGLRAIETPCEPAALMEAWAGARRVFVVDACASMVQAGHIHRFDAHAARLPEALGAVSSHGIGLGMAIELARALNALPQALIVFAIEGADFAPGAALSSPVAAAVAETARRILVEAG
jgi:hydrogenase maturation protease